MLVGLVYYHNFDPFLYKFFETAAAQEAGGIYTGPWRDLTATLVRVRIRGAGIDPIHTTDFEIAFNGCFWEQ
jgi:hypothetical protein